jgi:hypothetical protein
LIVPLNVHPFSPKAKTPSCSGNLNHIALWPAAEIQCKRLYSEGESATTPTKFLSDLLMLLNHCSYYSKLRKGNDADIVTHHLLHIEFHLLPPAFRTLPVTDIY